MRREWNVKEHRRNERDFKWNGFTLKGDSWYGFDWYDNPIVITKRTMNGMVLIFIADGHQWHDKWINIDNQCIPLHIQQQLYVIDYFKGGQPR